MHIRIAAVVLLVAWFAGSAVAQPWIRVLIPNGGENWIIGSVHDITWTDNFTGNLQIELYRADIQEGIISINAPNSGSFTWIIPPDMAEGTDFKIKIISLSHPGVMDWSDTEFALSFPPSLHITSPLGGEIYCIGDSVSITWTSVNMTGDDIHIMMKRNYPSGNWINIETATVNDGHYDWVSTGPPTTALRFRLSGTVHTSVVDTTNAPMTLRDSLSTPVVTIHKDPDAVRLNWTRVPCATFYQIWSSTIVGSEYSLLDTTTGISYAIDPGLAQKRFYYIIAGN